MLLKKALITLIVSIAFLLTITQAQAGTMTELFPAGLVDRDGNKVTTEVLSGKFVGLYFAAGWCQSCQGFTPALVPFRNQHADEFEIVFVSSDKSKADQFAYMKNYDMRWPTLEYRSKPAQALKERFNVTSIPTLIILSPEGGLISLNGRQDVESNPSAAMTTWKKTAPAPLPYSLASTPAVKDGDILAYYDQNVIDEVRIKSAMPRQGWIKGTIGEKPFFLAIDATSSTITGKAGDFPIEIKIDEQAGTIRGTAHNSMIDLQIYLQHGEYRQEGDIYGYFFWHGIDWGNEASMGGASCTILELSWDESAGNVKGYLGERKVNLKFDKNSGQLKGDLFNRNLNLQLENLDLTDFIRHFYLFLR